MPDLSCPVCKSDSYLNPNIKILVSPCFHRLCEQCVYRIFSHGYAPCPQCQTPLRRINYISSTFEDIEVEREIKIRKLLHRNFERKEAEFKDTVEYNDYLEEFENLVFKLLDLKNENQIREIIQEIKSSQSILNSKYIATSSPVVETFEENINIKTPTAEAKTLQYLTNMNLKLPNNLIHVYEPGGLTLQIVSQFIVYSVFE